MDVLQGVADEVKQTHYQHEDYNKYHPLNELNNGLYHT